MEALPHDPDIKALLRLGVVWNIPMASNRASADFLLTSPLMHQEYDAILPVLRPTLPWARKGCKRPFYSVRGVFPDKFPTKLVLDPAEQAGYFFQLFLPVRTVVMLVSAYSLPEMSFFKSRKVVCTWLALFWVLSYSIINVGPCTR